MRDDRLLRSDILEAIAHWIEMISMRNILFHGYFGVDLETVWGTVVTDLPSLKRRVQALLEEV